VKEQEQATLVHRIRFGKRQRAPHKVGQSLAQAGQAGTEFSILSVYQTPHQGHYRHLLYVLICLVKLSVALYLLEQVLPERMILQKHVLFSSR